MDRKRPRRDEEEGIVIQRGSDKVTKSDIICPICFDIFKAVQVTTCGHSFCHDCIKRCLTQSAECPVCKSNLTSQVGFAPNFSLNDIVVKVNSVEAQVTAAVPAIREILRLTKSLNPHDLDQLKEELEITNEAVKKEQAIISKRTYTEFLTEAKRRKLQELEKLNEELHLIDRDLEAHSQEMEPDNVTLSEEGTSQLSQRNLCLHGNFVDLLQCYFSLSNSSSTLDEHTPSTQDTFSSSSSSSFCDTLTDVTKYSSFQELSTLYYGDGPIGSSSIVSSIEFDKDGELFAVGGVTKRIKIFDYSLVTSHQPKFNTIHYPVREILCHAKISSVAYNPYLKQQLAASDYDGTLSIWDTHHSKCIHTYQEHEKRVWSVSYNSYDSSLLATGGDDCSLKLWHLTLNQSAQSQPTRANVCSVRFQPGNRYCLAYGSADHMIRLVDIRKFSEPILSLRGHKKAVSYVQYLNDKELVSASTDSELKLWSVETGTCLRTYKGHVNDKNFVGLSVNNGYITCGSENNSFYVYQKYVSQPILKYKFSIPRNILPGTIDQRPDEGSDFVSAVCSRKDSRSIVAANSQGFIKVLEMT